MYQNLHPTCPGMHTNEMHTNASSEHIEWTDGPMVP
jgi:hypothetical protein